MNKILSSIAVLILAGALSGCETIKCTATGPFIGLSKDIENARNWILQTRPVEKVSNTDAWIQKNLW